MVCKILRNAKGLEWLKNSTGIDPSGYLFATYYAEPGIRVVELYRDEASKCEPEVFELEPFEA